MEQISQSQLDHLRMLIDQNPAEARDIFLTYQRIYANDANFQLNSGGLFIDIGSELKDSDLIHTGIKLLHQSLSIIEDEKIRSILLYNLGNGYSELHSIARRQPDFSFDLDTTPLIDAKRYYREALKLSHLLDNDWQAQLRVNYANCLSGLGRSLEAISEYKTALDHQPDHPMAWGNLGVELEHFAFIAGNPTLLHKAYDALSNALANEHLVHLGGTSARVSFERTLHRIERFLSEIEGGDTPNMSPNPPTSSSTTTVWYKTYVEFCMEHQLFLNFCLDDQQCTRTAGDSVLLSLITKIDDNTTFPRLGRVVNEIKERYATARLLVFEAYNPPYNVQAYDEMTHYMDNLDYAVYGVRVAKLKMAFETAYNILDKIGFFINKYLNLGIGDRWVSFSTIWQEKEVATLRPSIAQLNNYHLYGLYDISRDLAPKGHLVKLRDIRNSLTHRYLVLHLESLHWLTSADSPKYHLGYREFLNYTIELMQLVRSAVIYMIAFIDKEERKKQEHQSGVIIPIVVPPYRHQSWGPADPFV